MKIKSMIDYLFWKRTWFRLFFIMLPIAPILLTIGVCYLVYLVGGDPQPFLKPTLTISFLVLFLLGIEDNHNMDGCDKKLKWK